MYTASLPVMFATGCRRSETTTMRSALSTHPGELNSNSENNIVSDLLPLSYITPQMAERAIRAVPGGTVRVHATRRGGNGSITARTLNIRAAVLRGSVREMDGR